MNAKTIRTKIEKAGFDPQEWRVEKGYKCFNVWLETYGLSDAERQSMTGDEVNAKRQADDLKVEAMARLLGAEPGRSGVVVDTYLAPKTWS